MSLILGIDTGGTYTDGVILECSGKKILSKAKAFTTKQDLTIGINNCIEGLGFEEPGKIEMVCLSTTLATNAIVEGLGCKTGLILIGGVPDGKLPVEDYAVIQGRCDIKGCTVETYNEEEIRRVISGFQDKVEALVISGYASIRNPNHELQVKKMAREILDIPVVCAHELTSTLGFYERTVTAVLNARLIPIIKDLIDSVKSVLREKKIYAPVMIVKGDGSLMKESFAEEKPIETILSGPAASIVGGIFLSGAEDALILDMGGTTTDIAIVEKGKVKIVRDGAKVGGWLTRVNAAEISTFGTGGDSYIRVDRNGQIQVGPKKVWPLCVIGKTYPGLADEIKSYRRKKNYEMISGQEADCFMIFRRPIKEELGEEDEKTLSLLQEGPHSLFYLAEKTGRDPDLLGLQELIDHELISRISVTPTDILHAQGRYLQWDRNSSIAGVEVLSERMGIPAGEFLELANKHISAKLTYACLQSIINNERKQLSFQEDQLATHLFNKAVGLDARDDLLDVSFSVKKPIVAIGAPVAAWMEDVAGKLNTKLIIPEHAEVANAIGAAVGQVKGTAEVLIRPDHIKHNYVLHSQTERKVFKNLEEAKAYAVIEAGKQAGSIAEQCGCRIFEVLESEEDIFVDNFSAETKTYIETRVKATAIGAPDCCSGN